MRGYTKRLGVYDTRRSPNAGWLVCPPHSRVATACLLHVTARTQKPFGPALETLVASSFLLLLVRHLLLVAMPLLLVASSL